MDARPPVDAVPGPFRGRDAGVDARRRLVGRLPQERVAVHPAELLVLVQTGYRPAANEANGAEPAGDGIEQFGRNVLGRRSCLRPRGERAEGPGSRLSRAGCDRGADGRGERVEPGPLRVLQP